MVKNLRKLRLKKGISQEKLADAIGGISQQSINKYENHKIEPDIQMLIKFADFFDTSVDYLIGNTDVECKIELLVAYHMTAEEITVMEYFRQLSDNQQESIKNLLKSIVDEK
ncbi:MAG: helix-turn-helix transcriptional regulator [Ruminococcus sp.]|nr:helix-turn-helix transcriptional regulator [Ruminococcus sp.]